MRTEAEVYRFQDELLAAAVERIMDGDDVCPQLHILGEGRDEVVGLGDVEDHFSYLFRLGRGLGFDCRAMWMLVITDAYVRLLADGEDVDATRPPGEDPLAVRAITVTAIFRDGAERSLVQPYDRTAILDPTLPGPVTELVGDVRAFETRESKSTFAVFFSGLRLEERRRWAFPAQEDDDGN